MNEIGEATVTSLSWLWGRKKNICRL